MAESTFGERLRYALFLIGWNTGIEPTQTQMAEAVGLTQPAVRDWLDRTEPPTNYKHHDALVAFAQVPKDWLLFGRGKAPEPTLWDLWVQRQSRRQASERPDVSADSGEGELKVNRQRASRDARREPTQEYQPKSKKQGQRGTKAGSARPPKGKPGSDDPGSPTARR